MPALLRVLLLIPAITACSGAPSKRATASTNNRPDEGEREALAASVEVVRGAPYPCRGGSYRVSDLKIPESKFDITGKLLLVCGESGPQVGEPGETASWSVEFFAPGPYVGPQEKGTARCSCELGSSGGAS